MKWSKQTLLGLAFSVGGSIMLFALIQQISPDDSLSNQSVDQTSTLSSNYNSDDIISSQNTLTADVETEQRILAQKHKERMARVAEQEKRTKEFLEEQERAEALALRKARVENEQYRDNNAIEPIPETDELEELAAQSANSDNQQESEQNREPIITRPTISRRPASEISASTNPATASAATPVTTAPKPADAASNNSQTNEPPRQAFDYEVQPGDGLIRLSRRYNVPVQALILANKSINPSSLQVGQTLEIPSRRQIARLLREDQARNSNNSDTTTETASNNQNTPPPNSPPKSPTAYTVARGDGLIKLARKYNMPVEALAQANNMSKNHNLQVGQRITIPSQAQISRLQREAEQEERRKQALSEANQRLAQARREASQSDDNGKYGVQVALADNQQRADEVASKLRAAGYQVSTSPTNRGVRVIVGPETGQEAALALKDKVNADSRTDISGAWVLRWR